MRRCSKCEEYKEVCFFSVNNKVKDGIHRICKSCISLISKRYYEKYKDSINNKCKQYIINNRPKTNEIRRLWSKNNSWSGAINSAKRRAKKRQATPEWLTSEQLLEIQNIYLKARQLTEDTKIRHEVDHIIPLKGKSVSGLHVPWNLQILTISANRRKYNKIQTGC